MRQLDGGKTCSRSAVKRCWIVVLNLYMPFASSAGALLEALLTAPGEGAPLDRSIWRSWEDEEALDLLDDSISLLVPSDEA